MPHPFSEDLRWQAIQMKEMLGYQVDEVAAAKNYQTLCLKSFKFQRSESKHHWKTDKKSVHVPAC